jgi:cytochrome P450
LRVLQAPSERRTKIAKLGFGVTQVPLVVGIWWGVECGRHCGVVISMAVAYVSRVARFSEPERLEITRDEPPAMLTFGGGVHYCLGAHLARVELAEALKVLARRMPNLRRTGPAPWKSIFEISGPTTLPIAFDAGH